MKYLAVFLSIIFLLGLAVPASAQSDDGCVYYFYGETCPHCANVSPFLDQLEKDNPELEIKRFEIYFNQENARLFSQVVKQHDVPPQYQGVPFVLVDDQYLVGDQPIIQNLESVLRENPNASCPVLSAQDQNQTETNKPKNKFSLLTIIGAALVDSINPCAIAVLLILLSSLFMIGEKKRALVSGLAFILSIFIAYLLVGIGLFSLIEFGAGTFAITGQVIRISVGVIAILIGLFNLKDFFWYGGGGFVMEIPRSWRPALQKMLRKVTSPLGAFLVGFAVTAFELPCTGGPYFFALGYLSENVTLIEALPILLLYNLFFVLPLLVIIFLIYSGMTTLEGAKGWKERNIKSLHLAAGIIMVLLGLAVLLRWV